ncbi:MAG TPA: serine hydrolase domain-containing protein [Planctomycetota bacterium]|nr:serine hydrolase domain-containing protein [Planctomycetota bacterium]
MTDSTRRAPSGPASPTDLADCLRPFVDAGALAGAVTLVADRDGVRAVHAVGFADVAARAPLAADALFWIASMSKPLTATALMMLVDEGRVDLDAPVERYLPEFAGQMLAETIGDRLTLRAPARPVIVADLLTHTSGMPFMSRIESGRVDRWSLAQASISYAMTPLTFEPGSRYEYCNCGTNTAGRIIEVVGGMDYEAFMRERLLDPLGMVDTVLRPDAPRLARLARTHQPDGAGRLAAVPISVLSEPYDDPRRGPCPAGGFFSTAHDIGRFGRMILRGGELDGRRYVSAAAVQAMRTRRTPAAWEQSHGLGWFCDADGDSFGHGGMCSTDLRIVPSLGLAMVYLVQHLGYAAPEAEAQRILPSFHAAAAALVR